MIVAVPGGTATLHITPITHHNQLLHPLRRLPAGLQEQAPPAHRHPDHRDVRGHRRGRWVGSDRRIRRRQDGVLRAVPRAPQRDSEPRHILSGVHQTGPRYVRGSFRSVEGFGVGGHRAGPRRGRWQVGAEFAEGHVHRVPGLSTMKMAEKQGIPKATPPKIGPFSDIELRNPCNFRGS